MRKMITYLLVAVLGLCSLASAVVPAQAQVTYYCGLTKLFEKGTTGWYVAWAACVAALIVADETDNYS